MKIISWKHNKSFEYYNVCRFLGHLYCYRCYPYKTSFDFDIDRQNFIQFLNSIKLEVRNEIC